MDEKENKKQEDQLLNIQKIEQLKDEYGLYKNKVDEQVQKCQEDIQTYQQVQNDLQNLVKQHQDHIEKLNQEAGNDEQKFIQFQNQITQENKQYTDQQLINIQQELQKNRLNIQNIDDFSKQLGAAQGQLIQNQQDAQQNLADIKKLMVPIQEFEKQQLDLQQKLDQQSVKNEQTKQEIGSIINEINQNNKKQIVLNNDLLKAGGQYQIIVGQLKDQIDQKHDVLNKKIDDQGEKHYDELKKHTGIIETIIDTAEQLHKNNEQTRNNLKEEINKNVQQNQQNHDNLKEEINKNDEKHLEQLKKHKNEIKTQSAATWIIGGVSGLAFLSILAYAAWPSPELTFQTADGTKFDLKLDEFHQKEPFYADMQHMMLQYNQSKGQLDPEKLQDIANEYKDGSHDQAKRDLFKLLNPGFNASDKSTYANVILNAQQTKLMAQITQDESNNKLFQDEQTYIYSHPNAHEKGLQKIHIADTGTKLPPTQTHHIPPPSGTGDANVDHSIFDNPLFDIVGGIGLLTAIYFGYKFFTQENEEKEKDEENIVKKDYSTIITEFLQKYKTMIIISGVISIGLIIYLFI